LLLHCPVQGANERAKLWFLHELDLVEEERDADVLVLRHATELEEQLGEIVGQVMFLESLDVDGELESAGIGELERAQG
jgi:hypothetical protein